MGTLNRYLVSIWSGMVVSMSVCDETVPWYGRMFVAGFTAFTVSRVLIERKERR